MTPADIVTFNVNPNLEEKEAPESCNGKEMSDLAGTHTILLTLSSELVKCLTQLQQGHT